MRYRFTVHKQHQKGILFLNFTAIYPCWEQAIFRYIFPSDKIVHETLEITHGFSDIFEMVFIFSMPLAAMEETGYAGSHIRPRVRIPESWNLPVG